MGSVSGRGARFGSKWKSRPCGGKSALPTAVIQRRSHMVALRHVDRLSRQWRIGNGAYLTRDEHLSNTRWPYPEGEGIYATSGRAAPLRYGANYMKGTIRVLAHRFCVNSKGHLRDFPLGIHGSVADASAERVAWPIVGNGKGIESQHSVAINAA